jgi:hypothetical protein
LGESVFYVFTRRCFHISPISSEVLRCSGRIEVWEGLDVSMWEKAQRRGHSQDAEERRCGVSESELRCDCDPDARPRLREADKLRYARAWYVQCDCGATGEWKNSKEAALWAWDREERTQE